MSHPNCARTMTVEQPTIFYTSIPTNTSYPNTAKQDPTTHTHTDKYRPPTTIINIASFPRTDFHLMYLPTTVSTPSRVHCRTLTRQLHPSGTSIRQHTPPPTPAPLHIPSLPHPHLPPSVNCTFPHPPRSNSTFPSTHTLLIFQIT